jgi:hypothetical protein
VRNDRAEVRYGTVQYKLNGDQTQTRPGRFEGSSVPLSTAARRAPSPVKRRPSNL